MARKVNKEISFSWKRVLVGVITLPILVIVLILGYNFISWRVYDYKLYKLNHLTKEDLPNIYTNSADGYAFNYPKKANVYKWFGTEENSLRVFSDGNNEGIVCDIYINDIDHQNPSPQKGNNVKNAETINYNNLTWQKWKDIDNTGSFFDRHFVSWYTEKGDQHVWITSIIKAEGYCESIVSTFRFTTNNTKN